MATTYNKNTDYQALINKAVASGDLTSAAKYEQQRNAKIADSGSTEYAQTNNYTGYLPKTHNGVTYTPATDYSELLNSAISSGNWTAAKQYETQRNAKIDGENLSSQWAKTYYTGTGDSSSSGSYESEYSDALNSILGAYQDAISSAGGVSMPGLSLPDYVGAYDELIDELLNKIANREEFSYNSEEDPLFQQYKDLYTKQGQLAMEDTMGVAAGLTGGYSSSYSQAVGQQQYNAYLEKLTEMMPEFYDRAYGQYRDEGTDMKDLYGLYIDRDQVDFQRYQQEVANAQAEYQAAAAAASAAAAAEQNNISNLANLYGIVSGADDTAYNRYLDSWNMDQTELDRSYQQFQNMYEQAQTNKANAKSEVDAILKAGGMPSSSLISASGVSSEYINAMNSLYGGNTTTTSYSGSSGSSSKKTTSAEPTITNKTGNGWVYVNGLGRYTYDELTTKVNSGEIKETYNKKNNTYTYTKKSR